MIQFSDLENKTLKSVEVNERKDEIIFETNEGEKFKMFHKQDCCEGVYIESITGNLQDIIDTPILLAEESTEDNPDGTDTSAMWTFYKLGTIKGYVDIRWYGQSNGYYGVGVDFEEIK